jgi:hypothetical protein
MLNDDEEDNEEQFFEKAVQDFMTLREAIGKPVTLEKAREVIKAISEFE